MNFGITQNFTTLEQKTINNDDETNHGTSKIVAEKFRTIICTTHIFRFNYMANKKNIEEKVTTCFWHYMMKKQNKAHFASLYKQNRLKKLKSYHKHKHITEAK